jgi:hypothetical protein
MATIQQRQDWMAEQKEWNRQFRFSNNLTTAGCLVRRRFDEPALLGATEGPPGRSVEVFRNRKREPLSGSSGTGSSNSFRSSNESATTE